MLENIPQTKKKKNDTVKNVSDNYYYASKNKIVKLNLSDEQAIEIWSLLRQNLEDFIVEKLEDYGYSSKQAKSIKSHFNTKVGKCHSCDFNQLKGTYVTCPKCHSFNYNLNFEPLFNQYFCVNLEYGLDFEQLGREDLKSYWCDKVDHIPTDIKSLSKSRIKKERVIKTKAWIGNGIHGEYDMTIKLGDEFVAAYMANLSLLDSIPVKGEKENWIKIDPIKQKIVIELK